MAGSGRETDITVDWREIPGQGTKAHVHIYRCTGMCTHMCAQLVSSSVRYGHLQPTMPEKLHIHRKNKCQTESAPETPTIMKMFDGLSWNHEAFSKTKKNSSGCRWGSSCLNSCKQCSAGMQRPRQDYREIKASPSWQPRWRDKDTKYSEHLQTTHLTRRVLNAHQWNPKPWQARSEQRKQECLTKEDRQL